MTKSISKTLENAFPEIAEEWHPVKNAGVRPSDVACHSNKKYWWKCKENAKHVWLARIEDRTAKKAGCPYCSRKYVTDENRLSIRYPNVAAEWHPSQNRFLYSRIEGWQGHKNRQFPSHELPEKNRRLEPSDLSYASNEIATWQCKKNAEHVWDAKVLSRTIGGHGCPYCSGNAVSKDNNLAAVHPQIAKQWHPSRNLPLTAKDVTPGSRRVIWWRCFKSADHVWQASVYSILRSRRAGKIGCPYCAGSKVAPDNNLAKVHPPVAKLWHRELNESLKPTDVTFGSNKSVFWQCPQSTKHVWQAPVATLVFLMSKGKSGCPFCSGKKAGEDNSLAAKCPDAVKLWHSQLNFPTTADDVTAGSGRLAWWHCVDTPQHAFELKVQEMVKNVEHGTKAKCPQCFVENSLGQAYPDVALLFHPERNKPLTINEIHPGSHKKVWWQCPYVNSHVWEQTVRKRITSWEIGFSCPTCKR